MQVSRSKKLTVLLACFEESQAELSELLGEPTRGPAVVRWAVVTAGELHVGEPDEGADEVLRAFLLKTHRDSGLRHNERLERIAEPMNRRAFELAIAELRRRALRSA